MRCVLLNSGGLDSAMVAKMLHEQGVDVCSLFVAHRQANVETSRAAAEETARRYCVEHHEITLDMGYPTNYYSEDEGTLTYHTMANLSMVMMALAVSYAKMFGIEVVYAGTHGHVPENYPKLVEKLLEGNMRYNANGKRKPPTIELPLLNVPHTGGYKGLAKALGVDTSDLQYTVSCRSTTPCGECAKCKGRSDLWRTSI